MRIVSAVEHVYPNVKTKPSGREIRFIESILRHAQNAWVGLPLHNAARYVQ
jgi:hypothetical protein